MTPNDKLSEEMQERIKADADAAAIALSKKEMCGPIELMGYRKGYIAGATAWAAWKVKFDELQAQAQRMADALEDVKYYVRRSLTNDDEQHVREAQEDLTKIESILQQFKDEKESVVGKCTKCGRHYPHANENGMRVNCGGETDRPCPHCGKELFRDRNLCCRACGKEVENETA